MLRAKEDLPASTLHSRRGWADESGCINCHSEAEFFSKTGHAQTLMLANQGESLALLESLNSSPLPAADSIQIKHQDQQLIAVHRDLEAEQEIPIEWCFGSGHHARTWVGTLSDSWGAADLVEFRYTWYALSQDFGLTPGQPTENLPGYFGHLGVLYDHPKALRCFACHATQLQVKEGQIDFEGIQPGVTCQRCHGPRQEHVDSVGKISDFSWRGIDHVESVHRCAECHRRAVDVDGQEIKEDNPNLARFQPLGLMQSACFKSQEMTCMTCHDPHLPLNQQKLDGIWQCTQCHSSQPDREAECADGHRSSCLTCHMPKVRGDSPLEFTDHWIRVRSESGIDHAKK
ncbi:multiheme c-type cytochrome [uncultured Rubinisphaera sp.]|uniref:multiheme c-type cytochrome n=1 Tax=uncultured Rubinisphaera sp. TaxID=1678686 RepID=UPI0030DB0360